MSSNLNRAIEILQTAVQEIEDLYPDKGKDFISLVLRVLGYEYSIVVQVDWENFDQVAEGKGQILHVEFESLDSGEWEHISTPITQGVEYSACRQKPSSET